jgi:molecular chaperone DnaK (HSP70)
MEMRKAHLLLATAGLLFLTACGDAQQTQAETPLVETVAPEIGPAQELGKNIDDVADTVKEDMQQTKTELGHAIDTAKKDLKQASEKVKTETNKAADKVAKTAKEASEAIKKETNKAADNVKKAAKDVKKDLGK